MCIQNFSNCHALFASSFFLLHSAAAAAWCGIQWVDPQMIHFDELFYHPVRRSQCNPQTIFV